MDENDVGLSRVNMMGAREALLVEISDSLEITFFYKFNFDNHIITSTYIVILKL